MKLHEEFKLFEEMWETDTDRSFKNKLMKAFINSGDRSTAEYIHRHEFFSTDRLAPGTATVKNGTISVHTSLLAPDQIGKARAAVKKAIASASAITENIGTGAIASWDDLITAADKLLVELIEISGNAKYDDGDGYWQEEYTTWCNRYLYYSGVLNDSSALEKLCADYSKKLPNIEFYCYEDEDISEIGYTATR
jgi:hypothetical protein